MCNCLSELTNKISVVRSIPQIFKW